MINTWWFNIIVSLTLFVIYNLVIKKALNKCVNDGAVISLIEFLAGIIILILCPFFKWQFPTDIKVYLLLFVSCIFYAITDRILATARNGLEVSSYGILQQTSSIFIFIWGILFFKEPIIIKKIIGLLLIIFGNILVLYKKGNFSLKNKYVLFSFLGNLFFSIGVSIDVGISEQFNLPFYVSMTLTVPAILIILMNRIKLKSVINEFKVGDKKSILIVSSIWGLMICTKLRAYQFGTFSTVTIVNATSVILNVIAAYFFLKEKDSVIKKIIAAILVAIGTILAKI